MPSGSNIILLLLLFPILFISISIHSSFSLSYSILHFFVSLSTPTFLFYLLSVSFHLSLAASFSRYFPLPPSPSLLLSLVSPSFVLQRAYRDVICPLTHLERTTCRGGAHSSSSSSHYFDFSKTCLTSKSGKTIGY